MGARLELATLNIVSSSIPGQFELLNKEKASVVAIARISVPRSLPEIHVLSTCIGAHTFFSMGISNTPSLALTASEDAAYKLILARLLY